MTPQEIERKRRCEHDLQWKQSEVNATRLAKICTKCGYYPKDEKDEVYGDSHETESY